LGRLVLKETLASSERPNAIEKQIPQAITTPKKGNLTKDTVYLLNYESLSRGSFAGRSMRIIFLEIPQKLGREP
jgi:hypothetical protein